MVQPNLPSYGIYSGADIKVVVHLPQPLLVELNEETTDLIEVPQSSLVRTLGELQTISWSIFREKVPGRTLGAVYPKLVTRGSRTIAGTMIFTVFDKAVLHELIQDIKNINMRNTGTVDRDQNTYTTALIDQLPPLDMSIFFANEYGSLSHMRLYGVEFVQEGGTFSIQDIFSEEVVQYIARDIDLMTKDDNRVIDFSNNKTTKMISASDLLKNVELEEDPVIVRRNNFI